MGYLPLVLLAFVILFVYLWFGQNKYYEGMSGGAIDPSVRIGAGWVAGPMPSGEGPEYTLQEWKNAKKYDI